MNNRLKIISFTTFAALMSAGLASCGGPAPATFNNTLKNSSCGRLYSFKLNDQEIETPDEKTQFKPGDKLSFLAEASEDYSVGLISYQTESGAKVPSMKLDGSNIRYTITLESGVNKVTPSYDIDKDTDFVTKFTLPISDDTFAEVMKEPASDHSTYDLRADGIERCGAPQLDTKTFINYVDGDTTHLETRNYGYTTKVRYLGIDTPESTSELEEWGKTASLYNKSCLESAKYIICHGQIASGGYNPTTEEYEYSFEVTTDGNQRNLLYVWYTAKDNPTKEDFRCLNLEMVYQGLSQGIGTESDMGTYFYRYFEKAQKSAEANKRHQFTDAVNADPNYYYDAPVSLTIKEIYDSSTPGLTDSRYKDKKTLYRVRGYVSRLINGAFYFQDAPSYDQTTTPLPDAYGMYVFTYAQTSIQVGDYVEVIGVLSDYGGCYQMMGISYHDIDPDPNRDTRVLQSGFEVKPIQLTLAQFYQKKYNLVLVQITDKLFARDAGSNYSFGGVEEIDTGNEKYPFYLTSNKIVTFATTEANKDTEYATIVSNNVLRFQIDENVLIKFGGKTAFSYRFFCGGSYDYNPNGAQYVNWNPEEHEGQENPYKDETVTKEFKKKTFYLTCISSNYISSSGKTTKYSAVVVSKSDVKSLGEWE